MRCRLLYLVGQLSAGGLERQLVYLLSGLNSSVHGPEVAVWNFCEQDPHVAAIRRLGVPLHAAPIGGLSAAKLMWFRRLVKRLRPQVVHSYSFFTNVAAYFGGLDLDVVSVGSRRNDFTSERQSNGPVVGLLNARWPRAQICNSAVAAESRKGHNGFFSAKHLFVVRNGIDLDLFSPSPWSASEPVQILAVGSLVRRKRWDRLLGSARALNSRNVDFQVRIAGEGPLREELERQAKDFGLRDKVRFLGYAADVPKLLADSAFLTHTSDAEGCPNAVMEAMACGRAVVATDAGEIPHLVEDGRTGFVVRRGDDAMLVERMHTLIQHTDLCRTMGEAGRAKAVREFRLDRLVEETLAAYRAAGWGAG
jgi:glycosyltransferase involved in cell wall biosynthesis